MKSSIAWLVLLSALVPSAAAARAKFTTQFAGPGFGDRSRVAPVGGNPGETLGEQRRHALQHAIELWEARLDSAVPIVFSVRFDDFGCSGNAAVLAGAAATSAHSDLDAAGAKNVDPKLWYVSALADSLVGHDLRPDEPDIVMMVNASVDTTCLDATGGFYYGLDSKSGEQSDFVQVMLHELGHGLGITSLFDPASGQWVTSEGPDSYSAHVHDLDSDATWPELSTRERVVSATNVRRLVWDGPEAMRLVPETFATGAPELTLSPSVAGFSGFIADSDFGKLPAGGTVSGTLAIASSCATSAFSPGQVVLVPEGPCKLGMLLPTLSGSRIAGLLWETPLDWDAPAYPLDAGGRVQPQSIPVVSISRDDTAQLMAAAGNMEHEVTIKADGARWIGADDKQRPLLFITQPYSDGSSVSHLEQLVRPNQLMEPFATTPTHDLTFTVAMLRDVGWRVMCGNGEVDPGEECDAGPAGNTSAADGCRADCRKPICGDGIKDKTEECDDGDMNSDQRADACRSNCKRSSCGDGVLDQKEDCDRGQLNSNDQPNACRMSCTTPYCGDGVLDALEQCDDGPKNSDTEPDACRRNCVAARCGDGVVDQEEECDQGRSNADAPDICRPDCRSPSCGDGIVDQGEECDGTEDCLDTCRTRPVRKLPPKTAAAEPTSEPDSGGCGCRVQPGGSSRGSMWLLFGIALLYRANRRRRAK